MAKRVVKRKSPDQASAIEQALGGNAPEERGAKGEGREGELLRHFSADEHIAWVEGNCYRDLKGKGWRPIKMTGWQKDETRRVLRLTPEGQLWYRTIMLCWIRRAGKSEWAGAYDLHRAAEYDDQVVVIQGNSEDQGEDTAYRAIVDMLLNSPKLRARVGVAYGQKITEGGDIEIVAGLITFGRTGSVIKVQPAKEATTYGQKIHVYHNTEGCKAANDRTYQTGASSTGDAWCGVAIVDSNMGDKSNFVCKFVELAQQAEDEEQRAKGEGREANPDIGDRTIVASYIYFADLADVLRRGCGAGLPMHEEPIHPWLDADWIRGRSVQMTRSEFLRNHCNQASGQGDELWTAEQIDPLFVPGIPQYAISAEMLGAVRRVIGGDGSWRIGVGLDRAGAFSKVPDRTVLSVVGMTLHPSLVGAMVPVYDDHGKQIATAPCDGSFYVLLGAWEYMYQLRDPLQEKLLQIQKAVGIGRICLEAYQASDLAEWCNSLAAFRGNTELRHMTSQAKQQLVHFAHGLFITRRFAASPCYAVLRAELEHYREDASGGGVPSYAGSRQAMDLDTFDPLTGQRRGRATTWIKDDFLEATLWAIEAAQSAPARSPLAGRMLPKPAGF